MRSLFIAAVVSSLSFASFACSAPADDASTADSAESALSGRSSTLRARYQGTLALNGADYTIELAVSHPKSIITTQTVRGSQIMQDSPHCDAYLESTRGNVSLRILGANGNVVAEKQTTEYFNSDIMQDDSACPLGLLASRQPIDRLDVNAAFEGIEFTAGTKNIQVPAGYGSPGTVYVPGSVSFEATGRSTFEGNRESDRGSSTLTTRGRARFELASSIEINVGLSFTQFKSVTLSRVY